MPGRRSSVPRRRVDGPARRATHEPPRAGPRTTLGPIAERDVDALVRAARAGDRDALEELLRGQIDRVHALCRRICGNDADAEDATQDALLAIVRGLPRFDGRSAFSTWVHRVATNACLDELRRRARRPVSVARLDAAPATSGDRGGATLDLADPGPQAEDRVPDRVAIDEALAALPADFRVPVVLRDQLGLDYAEIAEVLGIPPGTVRSRIARGRGRLADLLTPSDATGHTEDTRNPGTGDDVQGSAP
jgi:RNA polymerase sigma-70 factor (ECF subfamily)